MSERGAIRTWEVRVVPGGRDVSSGTHRGSGQDKSKLAEGWGGEEHVPDSVCKGWSKKEKTSV